MRIRGRITSTFTIYFGLAIAVLCITIYILSSSSRATLFNSQLKERIAITENYFLEAENQNEIELEEIKRKFLRTLPDEVEFYQELDHFGSNIPDTIQQYLPSHFKEQLSKQQFTTWTKNGVEGIAKIYTPNNKEYVVLVMAKDTYGLLYLSKLKWLLISASLITIVLSYALSSYFGRKVLEPVAGKIAKANRISAQNLDLRLTVYNEKDELGMLAMSFNNLLDRLQESFELQKNFVRYASHEMKNPLAIMIGEAEVALAQQRSTEQYALTIEKLKRSAESLNTLVEHFLNLSRFERISVDQTPIALDEVVMEVIIQHSSSPDLTNQIEFNVDPEVDPEDLLVRADKTLFSNALYNIIDNAIKFSPESGKVEVNLNKTSEGKIQLSVIDSGIGIPEEDIGKVFEPLFRSNNARNEKGSGIGLSLVSKILHLHQFKVTIRSKINEGTTVSVIF